jgi:hypothetical protein
MAMELGGRATKLGPTYERLWAVRQALEILQGRSCSLLWEPKGEDEDGIDLWVTEIDGRRVGYQLKRENQSKEYWSVGHLAREGVLQAARTHLERDEHARFVFVSSCGARHIRDLAEQGHRTNDDPDAFFRDHVCTNQDRHKAFLKLMGTWGLDPEVPVERARGFRLLQRMSFEVQERTPRAWREAEFTAGLMIDGDPRGVAAALGSFLDDNLGNDLHADQLRNMLSNRGFRFRSLAGDPSLPAAIERLQRRFDTAIVSTLIAGVPIQRPEAADLLSKIRGEKCPRLIFVHGAAGCGKSVVVHQLYQAVVNEGMPCLPIQLHIRRPEGSPNNFGHSKLELPASPALSLRGLAGDRRAVLMLDQLDALRLTSINSHAAWEACAELIEEAAADPLTVVVVACRTFDLENDPKISAWKRQCQANQTHDVVEIRVGDLPEAAVADLTQQHGVKFSGLPVRQQRLLLQPTALALWWSLAAAGKLPAQFDNAMQLMRAVLALRRTEAVQDHSVSQADLERVLTSLVAYMDAQGRLDAPQAMLANHAVTVSALCSVGLLMQDGANLSFVHQSYFDYLVAEHVLTEAVQNGREPIAWVRANQSLFRRDQLRQLLTLLRDADKSRHEALLRSVLRDRAIRFHLKHLVLGLLSQADPPLDHEVQIVIELAEKPNWWGHVYSTVIWMKPAWFDALDRSGCLTRWLSTWTDDGRIRMLLRFLRMITEHRAEQIDQLLASYWEAGEPWESRLQEAVTFDISNDSPSMAAFRLKKIRAGEWHSAHLYLDRVAEKNPSLVVPLLEAAVFSWIDRVLKYIRQAGNKHAPRWELHEERSDAKVLPAIRADADRGWAVFSRALRLLKTLDRLSRRGIRSLEDLGHTSWGLSSAIHESMRSVEKYLVAAVEGLATTKPNDTSRLLASLTIPRTRGLERAIAEGLLAGGNDLADSAMDWLCEQLSRPRPIEGHEESGWRPVTNLIGRFGPVCSDTVFRRLESRILAYHDEGERCSIRLQYDELQEGRCYQNAWGKAQNRLLRALPAARMSEPARMRAAAWRAKFGEPVAERISNAISAGRWVRSPIPPKRLPFLSDRTWLKIISRERPMAHAGRWKQLGPNVVGEASVRHFAEALGSTARQKPKRFARLALQIPPVSHPAYFASLLNALADEKPAGDAAGWEPAETKELEAVVTHVGDCRDSEYVHSVCRLITSREDAHWSDVMIDRIIKYADHPQPLPDEFTVCSLGPNGEKEPDVGSTAINCVRGSVASAIIHLLWTHPDAFERLLPTVKRLLSDPHPSVRHEALGACLPIWKRDQNQAVDLMLQGCNHRDDRVLQSRWLADLLRHARFVYPAQIAPLIKRMAYSSVEKVAEHGAAWATACHIQQGLFPDRAAYLFPLLPFWGVKLALEAISGLPRLIGGGPGSADSRRLRFFERCRLWCVKTTLRLHPDIPRYCRHGTPTHRLGVADVATSLYSDDYSGRKAAGLLVLLFDDDQPEVRGRAARVFRSDAVFQLRFTPKLAAAFAHSQAFQDNPDDLFFPLTEFEGDLRQYAQAIIRASEVLAGPLAAASRDIRHRIGLCADNLAVLLMRLYECACGSSDRTLENACLDRWDLLLANRVGLTEAHLRVLDN